MYKKKKAITEYRRYTFSQDFPVIFLDGPNWRISDVPSGRLHFHNCLEIGLCRSDSGTLEILGETLAFKKNDVTCIPRNMHHTTYSDPGTKSLWTYIFFQPSLLFKNMLPAESIQYDLSDISIEKYKCILEKEKYPYVHTLLSACIKEMREKKNNWQYSTKGLLLALYIELYRIETQGGFLPKAPYNYSTMPVILRAIDLIEDHYMEQFTMEDLAALCCMSPTHFRRVFFSFTNTSPLVYLNNVRVVKSCMMLDSKQETILNIAEMCGFGSVSNFNRHFKRLMGMTPKEYRKRQKTNDTVKSDIFEFAGWTEPEK